jgi:hypothetical protein
MLALRSARSFVFLLLSLSALPAQDKPASPKDDDEVKKIGPIDPYTGGDAVQMAAAGIVAYGPFPWADHVRTEDVDLVLGEGRVLWVESAHFRFGCNLRSIAWPEAQGPKKALQDEIKALRKKLPKVAEKPKRIDPWLRLHLAVQRAEKAYGEFQQLLGATDADFPPRGNLPGEGVYLGMPDKFLLLLFQKKSDMARYMEHFCQRKENASMRYYHDKTCQLLQAMAAEGLEGFDESGLHGHMVYALWHNLMNGYNGFHFPLPLWLSEGLAHWYARKVESNSLNIQIKDDEAVAAEKQDNWPVKVRKRAQHDGTWIPFDAMAELAQWQEMGYQAHSQSWSRIDYLMQTDRAKVGLLLKKLKHVPSDGTYEAQGAQLRKLAKEFLFELFAFDGASFDQKWRDWVTKTYPTK